MLKIMRMMVRNEIHSIYQPIVNVPDNEVLGYEALARCKSKTSPLAMFNDAATCGLIRELDTLCVNNAIENAPANKPVFVNILPFTLIWLSVSGKMPEIADKASVPVVFEIVETEQAFNVLPALLTAVRTAKKLGFKIAIDDISQGFDRLQAIPSLRPDYIKIDRNLVARRSRQYNTIKKSIINMAHELGLTVIAEGVQTEGEFNDLYNMGVKNFQGYYFAKPGEEYPKNGRYSKCLTLDLISATDTQKLSPVTAGK